MEEPQYNENKIIDAVTTRTKPKGRLTLPKGERLEVVVKKKNKVGRPTDYNQDIADRLCAELALGKSLRTIIERNDNEEFPCMATVFNWFRTYPEFLEQYTRAKQESADAMADEILDIADDGRNDWMTVMFGKNEVEMPNREVLARSKLRVDARIWLMSKMKPKKYGDRLLEAPKTPDDENNVVKNEIIFVNFRKKEDKETDVSTS